MASEMPVLPEVASRMMRPGVSSPEASAASIIFLAMRSLSEPVGLSPSSFAHSLTAGFGLILGMPTRRVLPIASRMSAERMDRDYPRRSGHVVGAPLDRGRLQARLREVAEPLPRPGQRGVRGPLAGLVVELPGPAEHVPSHELHPPLDGKTP